MSDVINMAEWLRSQRGIIRPAAAGRKLKVAAQPRATTRHSIATLSIQRRAAR